jgi:DNA-binding NarL/FixJ family response regulator
VLAVLRDAGEVEGTTPFPEPVLDALRRLVPCDVVTYHERVGGQTSEKLTPREQEILELVAEGRTNQEISALLWISPGTVRKHLENTFEKLEVHTRTAAAAAVSALREGARRESPGEQK